MADALSLKGVTAGYGETYVLERVDLSLAQGESLSIIGRNGVGKSTLLETVMGHTTLHAGEIRLGENRIDAAPPHRRAIAGLGYVPQEREIFPSLSVLENLEICVRPGRWNAARVFELFPNLRARLSNGGTQLSGYNYFFLEKLFDLLLTLYSVPFDHPKVEDFRDRFRSAYT